MSTHFAFVSPAMGYALVVQNARHRATVMDSEVSLGPMRTSLFLPTAEVKRGHHDPGQSNLPQTTVGEKERTKGELVEGDLPVGRGDGCEGSVEISRVPVKLEPVHTSAGGHVARLRVAEDRARLDVVGKRDRCGKRRAVVADVSVRDTK